MSLHIGVDIDDCIYNWYSPAHNASERAGITNGVTPVTWHPYDEYGCTYQEWTDAITPAILDGSLYLQPPIAGARRSLSRLKAAGHVVHLVTARASFVHGDAIEAQTREWLAKYEIPHDTITFSNDKTVVPCDYFIDDHVSNVKALTNAGVIAYMMNRPWNAHYEHPHRVDHVREFVDIVLEEAA